MPGQPADADHLDPRRRAMLARLADQLIPEAGGMPSASAAGVAADGLDRVLASRPDLLEPLLGLLDRAGDGEPAATVARIQRDRPSDFDALFIAVAGAYYTSTEVRRLTGYTGQIARPVDSSAGIEEDLLEPVRQRGPCYRRVDEGDDDE
jgi:hypothetical protein